jgi:hypothetical protein
VASVHAFLRLECAYGLPVYPSGSCECRVPTSQPNVRLKAGRGCSLKDVRLGLSLCSLSEVLPLAIGQLVRVSLSGLCLLFIVMMRGSVGCARPLDQYGFGCPIARGSHAYKVCGCLGTESLLIALQEGLEKLSGYTALYSRLRSVSMLLLSCCAVSYWLTHSSLSRAVLVSRQLSIDTPRCWYIGQRLACSFVAFVLSLAST